MQIVVDICVEVMNDVDKTMLKRLGMLKGLKNGLFGSKKRESGLLLRYSG